MRMHGRLIYLIYDSAVTGVVRMSFKTHGRHIVVQDLQTMAEFGEYVGASIRVDTKFNVFLTDLLRE